MRHEADFGRRRVGWGRPTGSGMTPAAVGLGSLTVPGGPGQGSRPRAFGAGLAGQTVCGAGAADVAALLTSELVTNAMLHTNSGTAHGTVTVVVVDGADGPRGE